MDKGGRKLMITLYSGTPGSGKSYHVIVLILKILATGRLVVANFPMNFTEKQKKRGYAERYTYMDNNDITVRSLLMYAIKNGMLNKGKESQCLVVIDEAGGRYNCRDFKDSDRKEWIDFFSQHRKFGFDFVLVAQQDRMLDRQIRGYLEYEKKHRKVNNYGPFLVLPFKVFIAIEYWYTAKVRTGSEFMLFKKRIAMQYDSMRMFSGFTLTKEMMAMIDQAKAGIEIESKNDAFDVPVTALYKEGAGD